MPKSNPLRWIKVALIAGSVGGLCLTALWYWLKSPYDFPQPKKTAETFIALLQKGNFQRSYAMTLQKGMTGNTLSEFKEFTSRQLCVLGNNPQSISFHPMQTNGNRLRRWWNGAEIEMAEINLEFEKSPCLFKVTLRHTANGQWVIVYFQSHAG